MEVEKSSNKGIINELGPATNLIKHPCRLILSGRSTMGKTTLGVDIICARILKSVNRCFAVCPTWYQQSALEPLRRVKKAFTRETVFTQASDGVFDHIFNICNRDHVPSFLFVDDSAAESSVNKGNKGSFSRLCLAAPHLNLTIFGCFQRLTQCSPSFRDNTEFLISFIPTTLQEVKTITSEFSPCPAKKDSVLITKNALDYCWANARFCFISREAFTGKIYYYCGFDSKVEFK